jgi:NAD(P)-dependent dehydrogenase (short-subunit alcohol dehydrogenase family)
MGRLAGKVAIVTGSTSGMGRKTSERFVEEGAKVVICGRRVALGRELEAKLGRDKCLFIEADVTKEEDVMRLIKACTSQWGRIDCLFNNAGSAFPDSGIETISIEDFDKTIASVLRSAFLGMKHAAPIMTAQRSGSIINNGSIAGHRAGYTGSFIYNAAKAAVIHLTRSAAMQLGEEGVRVNSISPGFIATGLFGKALGIADDKVESTAEIAKQLFTKVQPIQRSGMPEDIAQAAVFLASDESGFVNGHDLVVDGGLIGGRLWSVHQRGRQPMREAFTEKR